MSVYQRGVRRRLAPMLGGDTRRIALAHAILLALPGVPVMRYGDEIGMGDDLRYRSATRSERRCSGRRRPTAASPGRRGRICR